jgi:hypothetical protein
MNVASLEKNTGNRASVGLELEVKKMPKNADGWAARHLQISSSVASP